VSAATAERRGMPPEDRLVRLGDLSRLRAAGAVWGTRFTAAMVAHNPWLAALAAWSGRAPGHGLEIDPRVVPVEEGETSINLNAAQALTGLLVLWRGAEQGVATAVAGNLAAGNHSVLHSLTNFCQSLSHPEGALTQLAASLESPALTAAQAVLDTLPRPARKAFAKLPLAIRRARALRLPAASVAAPAPGVLRGLAGDFGMCRELTADLVAMREAMPAAGLGSCADLAILWRAALVYRAAALIGLEGEVRYLPCSLEYLLAEAGDEDIAGQDLAGLAARYHPLLARLDDDGGGGGGGGHRAPFRRGSYRLLNFFAPDRLLAMGVGTANGSRLRDGWDHVDANRASGQIVRRPGADSWLGLPLRELLGRGFGLSGKLTYMALRAVNAGRICIHILNRERAEVYAPLAEPGHPCLALLTGNASLAAAWQPRGGRAGDFPLDFTVFMDWLHRSADPAAVLRRLVADFERAAAASGATRGVRLVLTRQPGCFNLEGPG